MLSLNICVSAQGSEQKKKDEGTTRVVDSREKSNPNPREGTRLCSHKPLLLNALLLSSKCKEFDL